MRSAKSISSIPNANSNLQHANASNGSSKNNSSTSPICRCRVMYLGSSVPHITKDGLQGIQEPLRELYPDKGTLASGNAGIDSWLSVWSNGILIENVDETGREMKRFFKIDALHYCAAVKYVSNNPNLPQSNGQYATLMNNPTSSTSSTLPTFLPLDSPHARQITTSPPIFASILRRTTGIKVLECHAFICKREAAANALVRCCFHAYADTMYAKQIGADVNNLANQSQVDGYDAPKLVDRSNVGDSHYHEVNPTTLALRRSKSIAALNDDAQAEPWNQRGESSEVRYDATSEYARTPISRRKNSNHTSENSSHHQQPLNENLKRQQKLSKSSHNVNQNGIIYGQKQSVSSYETDCNGSNASCANGSNSRHNPVDPRLLQQVPQPLPFFNPIAGRVPSYPPHNMIDSVNNGGTLRSIKSMAANSIASTLMRSKKHAKAMSIAQLNQDKVTSFHQPHLNANTLNGSLIMPPVPPMFLPHLQVRPFINGSQTVKLPSRSLVPIIGSPANFETLTPKEIKKMLKKNAKYGLDPNRMCENGLPLLSMGHHVPPPLIPPFASHLAQHNGSGTMVSQSMYSDVCNNNIIDLASGHGFPGAPMPESYDPSTGVKPILVKPNAEFLKSKAGKKWVKQQKEFKKLLPPHLDGLPIVFGPPPPEALEPVHTHEDNLPMNYIPAPLPMMDTTGYYNPNQLYSNNGRASAASTLLRYSPHSQIVHDGLNVNNQHDMEYLRRNHHVNMTTLYNNPSNLVYLHGREHINDGGSMIYNTDQCNMSQHLRPPIPVRHQKQNHMVEQSVISLGDENDYDEEEEEEEDGNAQDSYYRQEQSNSESRANPRRSRSSQSLAKSNLHPDHNTHQNDNHHDRHAQAYEQVSYPNDDQGSYSSGIYKRGHINERAFSYSIQQEHKSGSGSNSDVNQNEVNEVLRDPGYSKKVQGHYSTDKRYTDGHISRDKLHSHDSQNNSQVNQLTARLESQLNMKSFSNSRIKF